MRIRAMNRRESSRLTAVGPAGTALFWRAAYSAVPVPPTARPAGQAAPLLGAWFKEARFGMLIHFGFYTLLARGAWTYYWYS